MYTLYWSPGAASLAVHLFLLEARLPHEARKLDFEAREQKSAEYLKLNPNGLVPTLVVDGEPMYESVALLLYLADRHSELGYAPALLAPDRRLYLQWMLHAANTLMPAFRAWWYPHEPAGPEQAAAVQEAARPRIEAVWDRLQAELERGGGPFLLGNRYSAADMLLTMLMRWSRNMPKPALQWPALRVLADAVRARPAWAELYRREGLSEW
jgi:glutathione S-transferase